MNKKAQSLFGVFVLFFFFIAIWIFFLAGFLNQQVSAAISAGSITGFEAFLWGNINLWIGIIVVIGFFFLLSMGGSNA